LFEVASIFNLLKAKVELEAEKKVQKVAPRLEQSVWPYSVRGKVTVYGGTGTQHFSKEKVGIWKVQRLKRNMVRFISLITLACWARYRR
jgi:hypothetical protein